MRCPWQTIEKEDFYVVEHDNDFPIQLELRRKEFGDCLKEECPFWRPKDGKEANCTRIWRSMQ